MIWGEDYPIRIFDANPLNPESNAKLLAEGTVNQNASLDVVMDCATALDKVFVARVDKEGHYLVQPVTIQNGEVRAYFGDKDISARSTSRGVTMGGIPTMEAPYTAEFIAGKMTEATVIQPGWDLAQTLDGVVTMTNFLFSAKVSVGLRLGKEILLKQDLRIAELVGSSDSESNYSQ